MTTANSGKQRRVGTPSLLVVCVTMMDPKRSGRRMEAVTITSVTNGIVVRHCFF